MLDQTQNVSLVIMGRHDIVTTSQDGHTTYYGMNQAVLCYSSSYFFHLACLTHQATTHVKQVHVLYMDSQAQEQFVGSENPAL